MNGVIAVITAQMLKDRTKTFALQIIHLVEQLPRNGTLILLENKLSGQRCPLEQTTDQLAEPNQELILSPKLGSWKKKQTKRSIGSRC